MFTHDPETHATWFSQSIIDSEEKGSDSFELFTKNMFVGSCFQS